MLYSHVLLNVGCRSTEKRFTVQQMQFSGKLDVSNQYQPQSKTTADNTSIDVVEVIITDSSPNSSVIDFQSTFVVQ